MNSVEIPSFWNVKNYITMDNKLCVPNTGELYVSLKVYLKIILLISTSTMSESK